MQTGSGILKMWTVKYNGLVFWSTVSTVNDFHNNYIPLKAYYYSRGETYISHGHLCVCLSVPRRIPTLLQGPGCNLGMVGAAL